MPFLILISFFVFLGPFALGQEPCGQKLAILWRPRPHPHFWQGVASHMDLQVGDYVYTGRKDAPKVSAIAYDKLAVQSGRGMFRIELAISPEKYLELKNFMETTYVNRPSGIRRIIGTGFPGFTKEARQQSTEPFLGGFRVGYCSGQVCYLLNSKGGLDIPRLQGKTPNSLVKYLSRIYREDRGKENPRVLAMDYVGSAESLAKDLHHNRWVNRPFEFFGRHIFKIAAVTGFGLNVVAEGTESEDEREEDDDKEGVNGKAKKKKNSVETR